MPYQVVNDAPNCGGFAVVKIGEANAIDGGCHQTQSDAIAHMEALNIATSGELSADQRMIHNEQRAVDLTPTSYMIANCKKGLTYQSDGKAGDGLQPKTVREAKSIASGESLSADKVKRMRAWIARHLVDLDGAPEPGDEQYPSPGQVAHLLWASGTTREQAQKTFDWCDKKMKQIESESNLSNPKRNVMQTSKRQLPVSYRPAASENTPTFKPSCGSCEYMCEEIDATGQITFMCSRWESPVAVDAFCDAYEIDDDCLPGWMADDDDEERAMMPATTDSGLVDQLRSLLADAVSLYFQAHGSHWNVRGVDFSQYHSLFAEIYEDVYSSIDPIAENVRKLGGEAPFTLGEFIALRSVNDSITIDNPQSLVSALYSENENILTQLRSVFDTANNDNQQGIANFIAERIDQHAKWSWQLGASLEPVPVRSLPNTWVTRSVDDKRSLAFTNVECRAIGDGNTLVGYASMFDAPSHDLGGFTEYVARGAFTKTLKDGADVRLLIDHEGAPLARTKSNTMRLTEDERGLRVEADLDPSNPRAAEIISALKRGDMNQMSFAFRVIRDEWSKDRATRTLKEVRLFDVSVVTFPAYEATVAEIRNASIIDNADPVVSKLNLRKRQVQIATILK